MKFRLSGAFGELSPVRDGRPHTGIDIAMPEGTELRSICEGVVQRVVDYGHNNIGKGVIIKGNDGNFYIYGHMSKIRVQKGTYVHDGSFIGLSGNTGHSTGPHLHFGIQAPNGHFIDPTSTFDHLVANSGNNSIGGALWERFKDVHGANGVKDNAVDKFMNHLATDLSHWCSVKMHEFHDWFTWALPDMVGYLALISALSIMLFSIVDTKWVKRTIGGFAAAFIAAVGYLTYN
ncbi:M23 family metallopeptidase [Gottfriedia sp. S16(2024)]|uniref:M23 family metallopeptidase n=1 Tax=Gottfriedia sp. S16(2024) TaxID=3162883 RepID=UPI003D214D6B